MAKPLASADRPLALRLRPDLIAVPVESAGAATWVVNDPLILDHFHFSAEEYALMDWLREPISLAELRRRFARDFRPRTITEQEIWTFVSRLHETGLLIGDATGQGKELLLRMRRDRMRRWALAAPQLLAIRFRGVDPDRFLTAVNKRCGWLFSRITLLAVASVVAFAAWIIVGHFGEVRARLPGLGALVDWRNMVWVAVAVGGVKILHELGHALVCKRLGGEVHEIGAMLLVFVPCLYTDVSDAWRMPNKWHRILISAAGMLVELFLASFATIVWWYAQPGIVQLIALDVMIVATVGTLAVNGNPLLRYDGYYILSDLVESPNLWQRSREVLRNIAARWLAGEAVEDDPLVPARHRAGLAAYAVASKVYLTAVLVAIVWGLVCVLYPLRLENLAYAIGLVVFGGTLAAPIASVVGLVRNPLRRRNLRTGRLATVTALALAATVAILALPVNYYVHAPLVLLPTDAVRVYATVDGTLATALPAGEHVDAGQTIAQLENSAIDLELVQLSGDHELERIRLDNLEKLRGHDADASAQIPAAQAALADLATRLADRRRDAERLTLTAPASGTVIAAPHVERPQHADSRLPQWSGAVLDPENRGALVEPGTLVCLVGDPARMSAVLLVDDTDISRVTAGQAVRIRLDQLPGRVLTGEVVDVARRDTAAADSTAAARADLAPLFAGLLPAGNTGVHYQARATVALPDQPLSFGARGHAKIAAERITLARWLMRKIAQTFRLPT